MNENGKFIKLELDNKETLYLRRNNTTEKIGNEDPIVLEGKEYVIYEEVYKKVEVYGTEEKITGFRAIKKKDFFYKHPELKDSKKKKDLTEYIIN